MRPPLHRNEIAKPLVRYFVRDHQCDPLAVLRGRMLGIDEKRALAIGNRAPVFHRAGGKIGDCDEIENGHRIVNIEVCVEKGNNSSRAVKRELCLMFFARRREDAHQNAVFTLFFDVLKIADDEGE